MSVTFVPAGECPVIYSFSCTGSQCDFNISAASYFAVADHTEEHFYSCGSSPDVEEDYVVPSLGVQVNLANANARDVLALLGVQAEEELVGEASADDFLGRILVAQGLNQEDGGRPSYQEGNIVTCGRRDNYYSEILDELTQVAQAAKSLSANVVWS